jgi:cysteinyl-tRNA synthetase
MLLVNQGKMSKSLGNFVTLQDALKKDSKEVVRWALLSTHYRQPLNWCDHTLHQARQKIYTIYSILAHIEKTLGPIFSSEHLAKKTQQWFPETPSQENHTNQGFTQNSKIDTTSDRFFGEKMDPEIWRLLNQDLNTPGALTAFHHLGQKILQTLNAFSGSDSAVKNPTKKSPIVPNSQEDILSLAESFFCTGRFLGFFQSTTQEWVNQQQNTLKLSSQTIEQLIQERLQARQERHFQKADEIRESLRNHGIELKDQPDGSTRWFYKDKVF